MIDKAEIAIEDISISDITDQYMSYLEAMTELELDVTSEFLVMAATLLSMKSRQLLPKPPVTDEPWLTDMDDEFGEDPREELIRRLIEYRKFKAIAGQLREHELERSLVYTREPYDLTPFEPNVKRNPVEGLHVDDLVRAFRKALNRVAGRSRISAIRRDEISVKDRIRDIMSVLKSRGAEGEAKVMFSQLIGDAPVREEIVATFLAVLELMKRRWVSCHQSGLFDEIVLTWTGREADDDGLFDLEIGT